MIESEDRLGDAFYTTEELEEMDRVLLEPSRHAKDKTNICMYHLHKAGKGTGLVLIAAVKSVVDGQVAIDRFWEPAGISAIVGNYNEEYKYNKYKVEAIYEVLEKYAYVGKLKLPGSDKVFKYEKWMDNLL